MKKIRFSVLAKPFLLVLFLGSLYPPTGYTQGPRDTGRYTLDEVLKIAVEKNPTVAVFRANLETSRGGVISSMAWPNPEVEVEGGRGRAREGSDTSGEYLISIGQPLEWPKKRFFRRKAAEAVLELARYEADAFMMELRYEVKAAFFRILLNKREEEIASENLKTVDELLKTVDARVKAGESAGFELVKARVESLKAAKELRTVSRMLSADAARLNSLLGNTLARGFEIEGDLSAPEKTYEYDELLTTALEKHPLILRQKKEIEARGYLLEREKRSLLPDVTIKGFFERELDKESYGVGLSVPIPIWNQHKGEIASARGEVSRAEAQLFNSRVEFSLALDEAYKDYRTALDQIEVFEKGLLRQAGEALDIAEFSYRQGESGLLDYLDAQRVHRETLLEYARARFELSLSVALIERLAGEI